MSKKIRAAAGSRPVVLLTGARQAGKSSLLQKLFSKCEYITFDHLRHVSAAQESPEQFLEQFKARVVLDEIQYVPGLFRELKIIVDRNRQDYGHWILTGSRRFELMEGVSESLAGRISIIDLQTLSAHELRETGHASIREHIWWGGYPELWSNEGLDREDFFESYIRTYVERDLKQVIEVRSLSDFRRFIKLAASRVGQLINYRDISTGIGVSDSTVRKWLHAMQLSGLVYLLPPFYSNIGKRLIRSPKLYFSDHGLACFLLNIKSMNEWREHPLCGALWENFAMMEMIKNHLLTPGKDLFFYRDHNGVEIDFLVERGRKLSLIEAKARERTDSARFNFSKVAPLFKDKYDINCLAALNIDEQRVVRRKEYALYNPLKKVCPL